MTDLSPRMQWPHPSENEDPFWESFLAFIRAMDASGFAAREDRNLLIMGGGTVSWIAGTGTLSWTSPIEFLSPNTGFLNQVPAGNVVILDGQVVRGNLARALGQNASMSVGAAGIAANNDNSVVLCIRRGSRIYWRNGLLMGDGDTVTNIGSSQGVGSTTLAGDATGPSGANTVERIRNIPVDPTVPVAGQALSLVGGAWKATSLGGDVSGSVAAAIVARLRGLLIDPLIAPASGHALIWDGAKWVAASPSGAGIKNRLIAPEAVVVQGRHQYIVQGSMTVEPGASLTVNPGGELVVLP